MCVALSWHCVWDMRCLVTGSMLTFVWVYVLCLFTEKWSGVFTLVLHRESAGETETTDIPEIPKRRKSRYTNDEVTGSYCKPSKASGGPGVGFTFTWDVKLTRLSVRSARTKTATMRMRFFPFTQIIHAILCRAFKYPWRNVGGGTEKKSISVLLKRKTHQQHGP